MVRLAFVSDGFRIIVALLACWGWAGMGLRSAYGQGVVRLSNHFFVTVPPPKGSTNAPSLWVDAPVLDVDGVTPLEGPAYLAQLYGQGRTDFGPVPNSDHKPLGYPVPFGTQGNAGFLETGPWDRVVLAGAGVGEKVWLELRVWESARGASFEEAVLRGGKAGCSEPLSVTLGSESAPGVLEGIRTFRVWPEGQIRSASIVDERSGLNEVAFAGGDEVFLKLMLRNIPGSARVKWYRNEQPYLNAGISGVGWSATSLGESGRYRAVIETPEYSLESASARVDVIPPPWIVSKTFDPDFPELGKPMTVRLKMAGLGPYRFSWILDGRPITAPDEPVLSVPNVFPGTYRVEVTHGGVRAVTSIVSLPELNGILRFQSLIPAEVTAPVFETDGRTRLEGSRYRTQLYWSTSLDSELPPNPKFLPLDRPLGFGTGTYSGFVNPFDPSLVEVPGVNSRGRIMLEMRAWDSAYGNTFEEAIAREGKVGSSLPIEVVVGNSVNPAILRGLQSFRLWSGGIVRSATYTNPGKLDGLLEVDRGTNVFVDVAYRGFGTGTVFQWFRNGQALANATTKSLSLPEVSSASDGEYWLRLTDGVEALDTSPFVLRTTPRLRLLGVNVDPPTPLRGDPFKVEVILADDDGYRIVWTKDGRILSSGSSRTIQVSAAEVGTYRVTVYDAQERSVSRDPVVVAGDVSLNVVETEDVRIAVEPRREPMRYRHGESVILNAVPNVGYSFFRWVGDVSTSLATNPAVVLMDRDRTIGVLGRPNGGTLRLGTWISGEVDAPVRLESGRLLGLEYLGQFYGGNTEFDLIPIDMPVPFSQGHLHYGRNPVAVLDRTPPGSTIFLRLHAWRSADGSTWEAAKSRGSGDLGVSEIITVRTGGNGDPPAPPAIPRGLKPFYLKSGPKIVSSPRSYAVEVGSPLQIDLEVLGAEPLQYEWFRNGSPLTVTHRSALLEIPVTSRSDTGTYILRVSNPFGSTESEPIDVLVAKAPHVLGVVVPTEPLGGQPLSLRANVENGDGAMVRWWVDGRLVGQGTEQFTLALDSAPTGMYSIEVSSALGTHRMEFLTLTPRYRLTLAVQGTGEVRTNPSKEYFESGTVVNLEAIPGLDSGFAIWFGDVSGMKPTISAVMDRDRAVTAVFSGTGGTVLAANRISGVGIDAPVLDGETGARLEGEEILVQLYGGPTRDLLFRCGEPMPLRSGPAAGYFSSTTVRIPSVPPGSTGWVQLRVWSSLEGATFEEAFRAGGRVGTSEPLSVMTGGAGSPPSLPGYMIGLSPIRIRPSEPPESVELSAPEVVFAGDPLRILVTAIGTSPLQYQWLLNEIPIPGATGAVFERVSAGPGDSGVYSVSVSNELGRTQSEGRTLRVIEPRKITVSAEPASALWGTPVTLRAVAGGRIPYSIQWFEGPPDESARAVGDGTTAWQTTALSTHTTFWARVTDVAGSSDSEPLVVRVEKWVQKLTWEMPTRASFDQPPFLLEAFAESGLPVDFEVVSGPARVHGSSLEWLGAGEVRVRAVQKGDESRLLPVSAEKTVEVAKARGTVFAASLEAVADGTPKIPIVLTEPAGLTTRIRYLGRDSPPMDPGEYPFVAEIHDANYQGSGTFSQRLWAPTFEVIGVVFEDVNGNGVREESESGLGSVSIRLLGAGDEKSYFTDDDGTFRFDSIDEGIYTVSAEDLDGFAATTLRTRTVSGRARDSFRLAFGQQPTATVTGSVFVDLDGDGVRGDGESGLPGVYIHLRGEGIEERIATLEDGSFVFTKIRPGSYVVVEEDPEGYESTTANHWAIYLQPDGGAAVAFGDLPIRTISGVVFEDLDGTGFREPGEPGLVGVTVRLADPVTTQTRETVTGPGGLFRFTEVVGGDYVLSQVLPPRYTELRAPETSPEGDRSLFGGTLRGMERWIEIADGSSRGLRIGVAPMGRVSALVFQDLDGDGIPSPRETRMAGVRVDLIAEASGTAFASGITEARGIVHFTDVPPGTHAVIQEALQGFQTPSRRTVSLPQLGAGAVFSPNRAVGTVSGVIFDDADGNQLRTWGENGFGNVPVRLQHENGSVFESRSSSDGTFGFVGLASGRFEISYALPDDFEVTTPGGVGIRLDPGSGVGLRLGLRSRVLREPRLSLPSREVWSGAGTTVELQVEASGWEPMIFRWYRNDTILTGQTNRTLVIASVNAEDEGGYRVEARNALGRAISDTILLRVGTSGPFAEWAVAAGIPRGADGPSDDPDMDGIPNALEFVFGTGPLDPADIGGIHGVRFASGNESYAGMDLDFAHAARGIRLSLERSEDLKIWEGFQATKAILRPGVSVDRIRLIDPLALGSSNPRFLRLNIVLSP